ncbi:MAG: hypothetical protein J6K32_07280 [Clostridia bacterium]|nr:hypothetical protein [Clostridia bacterium]
MMKMNFEMPNRNPEQENQEGSLIEQIGEKIEEVKSGIAEMIEEVGKKIEQAEEAGDVKESGEEKEEFDNNGSSCGRGHGCMGSMWCGRQRP